MSCDDRGEKSLKVPPATLRSRIMSSSKRKRTGMTHRNGQKQAKLKECFVLLDRRVVTSYLNRNEVSSPELQKDVDDNREDSAITEDKDEIRSKKLEDDIATLQQQLAECNRMRNEEDLLQRQSGAADDLAGTQSSLIAELEKERTMLRETVDALELSETILERRIEKEALALPAGFSGGSRSSEVGGVKGDRLESHEKILKEENASLKEEVKGLKSAAHDHDEALKKLEDEVRHGQKSCEQLQKEVDRRTDQLECQGQLLQEQAEAKNISQKKVKVLEFIERKRKRKVEALEKDLADCQQQHNTQFQQETKVMASHEKQQKQSKQDLDRDSLLETVIVMEPLNGQQKNVNSKDKLLPSHCFSFNLQKEIGAKAKRQQDSQEKLLSKFRKENDDLSQTVMTLKASEISHQKNQQGLEEKLKDSQLLILQLKSEKEGLLETVKTLRSSEANRNKRCEVLEKDVKKYREYNEQLKGENESLMLQTVKDGKSFAYNLEAGIAALEKEVRESKSCNEQLKRAIDAKNDRLNSQANLLSDLKQEIDSALENLKVIQSSHSKSAKVLEKAIADCQTRNTLLEAEIETKNAHLEKQETLLSTVRVDLNRMSQCEARNTQLREETHKMLAQLEIHEAKVSELEQKNKGLSEEVKILKSTEAKTAEEDVKCWSNFNQQLKALEDLIDTLNEEKQSLLRRIEVLELSESNRRRRRSNFRFNINRDREELGRKIEELKQTKADNMQDVERLQNQLRVILVRSKRKLSEKDKQLQEQEKLMKEFNEKDEKLKGQERLFNGKVQQEKMLHNLNEKNEMLSKELGELRVAETESAKTIERLKRFFKASSERIVKLAAEKTKVAEEHAKSVLRLREENERLRNDGENAQTE